jgi:hypothetical protein
VSRGFIYVSEVPFFGEGRVGKYTTSGATVNASLITGLGSAYGLAVSGTNLFVSGSDGGAIGLYTTSRQTVNASLISTADFFGTVIASERAARRLASITSAASSATVVLAAHTLQVINKELPGIINCVAVFGESFTGANEFHSCRAAANQSPLDCGVQAVSFASGFGISFRACFENILPPPKPRRFS